LNGRRLVPCLLACVVGVGVGWSGPADPSSPEHLIAGGLVVDGSGTPGRILDVRIVGGLIAEIGPALVRHAASRVIDARGLVVAPGFIDLHSHLDQRVLSQPGAGSQIAQGITTALVGLDGESAWPVDAFLDRVDAARPALDVATLVGHATLRRSVVGPLRPATAPDIERLSRLVDAAMRQGAFGLSAGLEYDPGFDAAPGELVALSARVAAYGGLYSVHLRDERERTLTALDEAVDVARRAGVRLQVSHLKLGASSLWGRARDALLLLGPDATADVYPYTYWVGPSASLLRLRSRRVEAAGAEAIAEAGGPARLRVITDPHAPTRAGRQLADIATGEGRQPASVLVELAGRGATLACECMTEDDLAVLLRDPRVFIASDGGIGVAHPRGAGAFPRVLSRYVRQQRLLTLESAIHKMTGGPADRLGLGDRGRLAVGARADVVVFDPRTVRDRATLARPHLRPEGIVHVLVAGTPVVTMGRVTGARPGRALRRRTVALAGVWP
jgi:N-acyl-D-amino-acid deacylase